MPLLDSGNFGSGTAVSTGQFVSEQTLRRYNSNRLVTQLENFPPMPTTGMEILRLTEDPNSTLSDLEEVLSRDPVLTGRIFKMANSSFFSRGVNSDSLHNACSRLGLKTVRNIVIACCAGQVMRSGNDNYAYQDQGIWIHSLYSALGGQYVAKRLGFNQDFQAEIFLSALVHDIGKLLLDPLIETRIQGCGNMGLEAERQFLGITHTEVGVSILEQWKLPDYCHSVVAHHHTLESVDAFDKHVALVHITDWMLNNERIALLEECKAEPEINSIALEVLTLTKADFSDLHSAFQSGLAEFGAPAVELQ